MKKKLFFLIIIIIIGSVGYFIRTDIYSWYQGVSLQIPNAQDIVENIAQEVEKRISTPEPLRARLESASANLTSRGTIIFTNTQRTSLGIPALEENEKLNTAAREKVKDMFLRQYFAHTSPTGKVAGDLVKDSGYEYIMVGENLALGNFKNDEVLVQAWMDSPGHRANILDKRFTQIGVAVEKGTYEGKTTWLAVQIFGKPLSSCPSPSASFKIEIEKYKEEIQKQEKILTDLRYEIENMKKQDNEYKTKIDEYNRLVENYNSIILESKSLIEKYNIEVNAFNSCATQ